MFTIYCKKCDAMFKPHEYGVSAVTDDEDYYYCQNLRVVIRCPNCKYEEEIR